MKIAVLSDIHGNDIAFRRSLDYLKMQEIDAYIILGDYSGDFPGIRETMDMIYELQEKYPVYIIRGNRENYLLSGIGEEHPEWRDYPSTVGMIRYNHLSMREKDWAFIRSLPETLMVRFDGMKELLLCHGSPRGVKEEIHKGNPVNREIFAAASAEYLLCGHTHRFMDFEEYGKHVLNPGSVGVHIDGEIHDTISFLILHSAGREWVGEHISLKQDVNAIVESMRIHRVYEAAPFWAKSIEAYLKGAEHINSEILMRAMEITEQECGTCTWPMIPEKYWARAFREMVEDQIRETKIS